jgi:hypothetical protein
MSEVDMKELLKGVADQMAADPDGARDSRILPEDLAKALAHPQAMGELQRLLGVDADSVAEGAPAPDFTLARLGGVSPGDAEHVTLSDHFGRRPVALIFGSYT